MVWTLFLLASRTVSSAILHSPNEVLVATYVLASTQVYTWLCTKLREGKVATDNLPVSAPAVLPKVDFSQILCRVYIQVTQIEWAQQVSTGIEQGKQVPLLKIATASPWQLIDMFTSGFHGNCQVPLVSVGSSCNVRGGWVEKVQFIR